MNKSSRVLWKTVAIFLSFIAFCLLELSIIAVYVGYELDFYTQPRQKIIKECLSGHLDMMCEDLYDFLQRGEAFEAEEYFKGQNFRFDVYNEYGDLIFSTRDGDEGYIVSKTFTVILDGESIKDVEHKIKDYGIKPVASESESAMYSFSAVGYIPETLYDADEVLSVYRIVNVGYDLRFGVIAIGVVSFLLVAAALIFLMSVAGHRPGVEKIVLAPLDVIPFDLYSILFYIVLLVETGVVGRYLPQEALLVLLPFDYLLAVVYLCSLAVRLKHGGLLKNTFVFMTLRFLTKTAVKAFRLTVRFFVALSVHWRCTLIFAGIFITVFAFYGVLYEEGALAISIVLFFGLLCLALKVLSDYNEIKNGVDRIASGELYHKIPTEKMLSSSKRIAERINGIQENLQNVVESGIKSECFKTELITNVSHDLKTPLTSIINYVDLIAKERLESEKLREYVSALERQAKRLKKLTEDLVEASKASTGNVDIEYTVCELGELLTQTFGEYTERLEKEGLTLCPQLCDEQVEIFADGKHLWRILDNVMSNTVKYALPSTRVWVSLTVEDGCAVIVFKNISREVISLSGAELTERFVRADTSRNSEGSGLGLSIAKSLTELQGGEFSVTVDGDLFKVRIEFPLCDRDN
ncbi:MAG: HAMP domain-containing histidine kinase [Clostridia bacterium]|nr:HAMP domain-containing histidine kinase [Clostridia bacterium]